MNAMEQYITRIQGLSDEALIKEWDSEEGYYLRQVEHEMALRFMQRAKIQRIKSGERSYLQSKFLRMPEEFKTAVKRMDWSGAKYIYDSAIRIALFMEISEDIKTQMFGSKENPDKPIEGMFPEEMVNRVMNECILKNRLGHECVVYRVPGEIGYFGAKFLSGCYRMYAEENPAYEFYGQ